ncbi:L-serine dehydratase [Penicillium atrosanguineum]|uniref:Ima1 N-terminal domain-containing protein n=1 Tax=Penicillium atrosanguineum TaxID=1132637 RepID=A0A9W9Q1K4_9EURO|nr:L-serine dehydratase [Penicillium atrosanguineum]KAJ5298582.1 L-serine dehydratase [Penicillium atrosanguineum]KAJ5321153.1 hypothetical protein N7476_004155 [Penicillium atrosanguineum]
MALFPKRLTCHGCGHRSPQPVRGSIGKFHCSHCDADTYLDQNGEITDPPAAETNPAGVWSPRPDPADSIARGSDLFCSQCLRNQHLLTTSLANYSEASDDPNHPDEERRIEAFRKTMEDQYPQVCDACEPRVVQRMRQAGYEAKADHLRRMMDRSRASKAAKRERNWGWRSLLVYAGALGYWGSVGGQLAWDAMSTLTGPNFGHNDFLESMPSLLSCGRHAWEIRRIPNECSHDLASLAGLSLVAGCLSIWWNPKLRMKVNGKDGRFIGLSEYYKGQLVVLVARCVFWALLKDPSASGLKSDLPPALHMFMFMFTILSVVVSRQVVRYDASPLVNWADHSWETRVRSPGSSPAPADRGQPQINSPNGNDKPFTPSFPIGKLATAPPPADKSPVVPPTPPPVPDDMDWTPSAPQNLRPSVSVTQRNLPSPSVFDGPSPFYGNLPAAPKPPAWNLRTRQSNKPIEQVVQPNPFHRSPVQAPNMLQQYRAKPEAIFQAPRFFPRADYNQMTGLEALFEDTFDISKDAPKRDKGHGERNQGAPSRPIQSQLVYQYLRLGLLLASMAAWTFSQNHELFVKGNYIEASALGSASLIAGFAFLEAVKRPMVHWNGMEILVYLTELVAAVHLGSHLPKVDFERAYFDRYGKLLLVFMTVQEFLGLLAFHRALPVAGMPDAQKPTSPFFPQPGSPQRQSQSPKPGAIAWPSVESPPNRSPVAPSFGSQQPAPLPSFSQRSAPVLSFGSSDGASTLSSALPEVPNYGLSSSRSLNTFPSKNPHSFTMSDLRASDPPSDYEQDSDTETIATTATNRTDATGLNIRYGRNQHIGLNSAFSPRKNELGSGIGGLSLEDRPTPRRMTRSQTQQGIGSLRRPGHPIR